MQQFLKFNIKQKLTLGFVMKGIAAKQDPLRRNVIAKVIMWLINVFLMNIIRSLFYVSIGNKVLFIFIVFIYKYKLFVLNFSNISYFNFTKSSKSNIVFFNLWPLTCECEVLFIKTASPPPIPS